MSPIGVGAQKHDPDLPAGWVRTKFSEIYELAYGKSLTKNTRNPGGKYPVFGSNGVVGYHDAFLVEGPTIVVGRKGAAGAVSFSPKPCWPIDTTYYVRDGGHTDVQFSFYLITSLRLNQLDRSTAIPGLNRDDAYHLVIRLPPLPEQHRIVAKIEQLFSELDKGIESLKTARAQLATYRQAVLKHAFEGKLTAQWREENKDKLEKPEQLLARIKQERAALYERQLQEWKTAVKEWEAKGRNSKKPPKPRKPKDVSPVLNVGSLVVLPTAWRWTTVSEIADLVADGTHHTPDYASSGIPFISVKNVRHGRVSFDDCKFISWDDHEALTQRCHPELGDLLITKSGTIGRLAIVPDREFSLFVSVALVKIQSARAHISSRWLRYAFEHHIMGLNIDQQIKGGLLKNYHLEDLRLARLPLCGVREQEELVRLIDERLSVLEQLDSTLELQLVGANALRQSILKKAFSGQLVAQDPHDEPASILLNKIKAEREKTVKNKTPNKKNKRETTA